MLIWIGFIQRRAVRTRRWPLTFCPIFWLLAITHRCFSAIILMVTPASRSSTLSPRPPGARLCADYTSIEACAFIMGISSAAKEPIDALLPGVVGDSQAMRAVYRL